MPASLSAATAERLSRIALDGIGREYPNQIAHVLCSDADAQAPRRLHPAFFGSYDWHSSVHTHWCLVRLLRVSEEAPWADEARIALARNLTPENLRAEADYLCAPGREGFERPYGLAWLLQLAAELREWAPEWGQRIEPLERLAAVRLQSWLPKLTHPIRSGEHSQTAFAMALAFDWARTVGYEPFEALLVRRALDFYHADRDWPLAYEPSGHDFLSPSLAEADLMRRILSRTEFADWLDGFLPEPHFAPVTSPDPADGKLAHLDGLNLSRAWMLAGMAAALPPDDPRIRILDAAAAEHAQAGLAAVTGEHYAGAHWLASFAVYLLTGRGLSTIPGQTLDGGPTAQAASPPPN